MISIVNKVLSFAGAMASVVLPVQAATMNLSETPLFISGSKTALVQLIVQRDNNLFFEAYPTYEDINQDGVLDTRYKPEEINYIGYFDSNLCYVLSGGTHLVANARANNKRCTGRWSGDFLNYLTMTRMDIMRLALYGGYRQVDTATETRLRRAFVPWENHTWGVEYSSASVDGYRISDYTPFGEPSAGRYHHFATNNFRRNDVPYLRIRENVSGRIWNWVDKESVQGDGWSSLDIPVDVQVCRQPLVESFCKQYPDGQYKPVGLLHRYGENDTMYFSLLTGSYENNVQGGVLRQSMSSFGQNEVDPDTGIFLDYPGIVHTLDAIQIPNDYRGTVQRDCGWIVSRPFRNGECRAWGNPVAEMMYEGMRYFSGQQRPTTEFVTEGGMDQQLGLRAATWDDPYAKSQPYGECTSAYQLIISDPSPSFDGDQLPGSYFSSFSGSGLPGLNVGAIADFISANDPSVRGMKIIGEADANRDGSPSAKMVTTLRTIRGQAPEAPHRQGSYYAPSVAYYGLQADVHPLAKGKQNVRNFTLALGSPIPAIHVDVGGSTISFSPYAKTVKGGSRVLTAYQPTNTLIGFNVESISPTKGSFRVTFEDMEQGADNDMDAAARYEYEVKGNSVEFKVTSVYAAGGAVQHMGYTVAGSTQDGIYLVVRDIDTRESHDTDFRLDVPPGARPGVGWADGKALPLYQSRTFTPSPGVNASQLKSPLWYAAKWGGFNDLNNDAIPQDLEWDADSDGNPDNYFLVSDPSKAIETVDRVFQQISVEAASASSIGVSSSTINTGSRIYQSDFVSKLWTGELKSFPISVSGQVSDQSDWSASEVLEGQVASDSREIITFNPTSGQGVPFRWPRNSSSPAANELATSQVMMLAREPVSGNPDNRGEERLRFIRGETIADFRQRDALLGDIVHSSPQVVAYPSQGYPDEWESGAAENRAAYSDFRKQHRNRDRVVYVGANDGMLHAFDAGKMVDGAYTAGTGKELFAYVPAEVTPNLNALTHPRYTHKYYVDGTPRITDAFDGTRWRTVLVGSLGRGGQGVFALDITNPATISEKTADELVLWEFTDAEHADMGYSYSTPIVVKMNNGRWAAVFANGYGSSDADEHTGVGNATLYVVDLFTGELIRTLSEDRRFYGRNGMSEPTAADMDGNMTADVLYAGDLSGRVYRYDVSSRDPANWGEAQSTRKVVFRARDDAGNPLPITSAIALGTHPERDGVMLYVGTGKYLEPDDQLAITDKHRLFGLWDDGSSNQFTRLSNPTSGLLQQRIVSEDTKGFDTTSDGSDDRQVQIRESTQEPIDWDIHRGWYMDLFFGSPRGEQVLTRPVLRDGKLFISTHIPTGDECEPQSGGWLMALNPATGAMLNESPFDLDNDGRYSSEGEIAGLKQQGNPFAPPAFAATTTGDVLLTQSVGNPTVSTTAVSVSVRNGQLTWRELVP